MRRELGLLIILVSGCTASMVSSQRQLSDDPNAPVITGNDGGEVKYLNEGASFVREERRRDAYRQMKEYCNGPYKIASETEVPQVDGFYSSNYLRIKFECLKSIENVEQPK